MTKSEIMILLLSNENCFKVLDHLVLFLSIYILYSVSLWLSMQCVLKFYFTKGICANLIFKVFTNFKPQTNLLKGVSNIYNTSNCYLHCNTVSRKLQKIKCVMTSINSYFGKHNISKFNVCKVDLGKRIIRSSSSSLFLLSTFHQRFLTFRVVWSTWLSCT